MKRKVDVACWIFIELRERSSNVGGRSERFVMESWGEKGSERCANFDIPWFDVFDRKAGEGNSHGKISSVRGLLEFRPDICSCFQLLGWKGLWGGKFVGISVDESLEGGVDCAWRESGGRKRAI